jgi:hypothetical protein
LRSEELFALRRNDVRDEELMIDEAIVDGQTKEPKTLGRRQRSSSPEPGDGTEATSFEVLGVF